MWGYGGHGGWMIGGQGGDWSWPFFAFSGVAHLLFWGLVIYAVVALVRSRTGRRREDDPALDLLGKRYVAGEISQEDYRRMKKDLSA